MALALLSSDLNDAIEELPGGAALLFRRLQANPVYRCRAGRMQLMVWYRDEKVGGLNRQAKHWYISKVFAEAHGNPVKLKASGFRYVEKNERHSYWVIQGYAAVHSFQDAIEEMTGVPI